MTSVINYLNTNYREQMADASLLNRTKTLWKCSSPSQLFGDAVWKNYISLVVSPN